MAVATAHLGLSQEALIVGDFPKAQEAMLQCVELLRALTDNSLLPFALGMLGFTAILNSDLATADYVYQESLGGVPVFTNKAALSLCYSTRSDLLFLRESELADSQKYAEKALSYALESGSAWAQLAAVVTIARLLNMVARGSFDYRSAFDDIVDAFTSLEDFYFANVCRSELAHAERLAGHFPEAETLYRQSIVIWHEIGQKAAVAHQLECFTILRQSSQQFKTAAMLFGAAEALREQLQTTMIQAESEEYNRQLSLLRQQLPEGKLSKFWQEGRQLDIDSAINLAQEK